MKVKICGLTRREEAGFLNDSGADYAGFVFHAPSKRNVTVEQTVPIMERLDPGILKVAVTVSPDIRGISELQAAGFDLLQIHGDLAPGVLEAVRLPVWYAVNLKDSDALRQKEEALAALPEALRQKITGIVVDGAKYGGGKPFDWEDRGWRKSELFRGRVFILAGGLNPDNVQEGIRLFSPDVVDVSSGVEGEDGKDPHKIQAFIREVKEHE